MSFTAVQVLAVLAAADRPIATIDVARECHGQAGTDVQAASSTEVRWALDRLAARGEVVSSSWDDIHHPDRDRLGGAGHPHLVAARDHLNRFWATPALSAKLALDLLDREERHRQAVADVEAFQAWWVDEEGPHFYEGSPAPHCHVVPVDGTTPAHETVVFRGTHAQLVWLMARLR